MRVLVEQVRDNVRTWLGKVAPEIKAYTLMGGEVEEEWEIYPERPAVLIGTQDMLLSRALNRGYAMSRYRWPVHFGLLNNDCLWILDEVQLMGSGLPTSAQLAAFRGTFGAFGRCDSVWMSATLDEDALQTVDFRSRAAELPVTKLSDEDLGDDRLAKRVRAAKRLARAPQECRLPQGLAEFVARNHRARSQTLVVVNRVERAREVFDELRRNGQVGGATVLLLHSRFRPHERRSWQRALGETPGENGRILVATQVIEAGVDISSSLLVTDVAPYFSLVQRFGRCNRSAETEDAKIYWVDRPLTNRQSKLAGLSELDEKQQAEAAAPYEWPEVRDAATLLSEIDSAAALDLPAQPAAATRSQALRRRDMVDLFDTTRDLCGYDLDISRFVRGGDEKDVLVAWREMSEEGPGPKAPRPDREELCPVPIGQFKDFLNGTPKGKRRRLGLRPPEEVP